MKRLWIFLGLLLAWSTCAWAALYTTGLTHRWQFTESAPPYLDSVGDCDFDHAVGTVVSAAAETGGAMTGVLLGDAAGADTSSFLVGGNGATAILSSTKRYTIEIVYRCYPGVNANVATAGFANIVGIANDIYGTHASGPDGAWLMRYMSRGDNEIRAGARKGGTTLCGTTNHIAGDSLAEMGILRHVVIVADSNLGVRTYDADLRTPIMPTKYKSEVFNLAAIGDTLITIGDSLNSVGQLLVVDILTYAATLDSAKIQQNHTAFIAAYAGGAYGDVWVDTSATADGYGTQTRPFKLFTTGIRRISPKWTVNLADGQYAGQYLLTTDGHHPPYMSVYLDGESRDGTIIYGQGLNKYPLWIRNGVWHLRDLTLDAVYPTTPDSIAGRCISAFTAAVDTLTADNCVFENSASTNLYSAAKFVAIDSCIVRGAGEHGIYLRNAAAAADYVASSITNNTFTDWDDYGIQVSNMDDGTGGLDSNYQFDHLLIEGNTFYSPGTTASGAMILAGTDSARVQNNYINLDGVTTGGGRGVNFSWSTEQAVGGRNALVSNNEIRNAKIGFSGGLETSDPAWVAYDNSFHNNFLVGCTTAFEAREMADYHLTNNCSVGATTPFPADSGGTFTDSTSWRMTAGGKWDLTGIYGHFAPVGIQSSPADTARMAPTVWFKPLAYSSAAAQITSPWHLLSYINDGSLPVSDSLNAHTWYIIAAPTNPWEEWQIRTWLDAYNAWPVATRQKIRWRIGGANILVYSGDEPHIGPWGALLAIQGDGEMADDSLDSGTWWRIPKPTTRAEEVQVLVYLDAYDLWPLATRQKLHWRIE